MHFGRDAAADERAKERDLLACLRYHEADVRRLYLLGDVFDPYIEYRHLIPKGFARLQGLLAEWTDRGVPVTYVVGNHDPWHRDYFARELGVRMVYDAAIEPMENTIVYLAHGDAAQTQSTLYPYLRPWLRHPVPVWCYRTLLPADAGVRLARWVGASMRKDEPEARVINGLRTQARRVLEHSAASVAVMGHSHWAELQTWPEGYYLNTGNWYESRTFGRLDDAGLHLLRWNGDAPTSIEAATLDASSASPSEAPFPR